MPNQPRLGANLTMALLTLAIIVATLLGFREVQLSVTSLEEVGALILTLGFVALVIERAVEVYVSRQYGPQKIRRRRPLTRAEARLEKAERLLDEERERRHMMSRNPSQEEDAHMKELVKNAENAHKEFENAEEKTWLPLSELRTRKLRAASILSLALGVLAALSGIRVLGQFLPIQDGKLVGVLAHADQGFQLSMFRVTDALLTALLLAGGADGIHKMFASFKSLRSKTAG